MVTIHHEIDCMESNTRRIQDQIKLEAHLH